MDNITNLAFAKYIKVEEVEKETTKGWVEWGDANSMPNYLIDLYQSSPVHGSLVNSISFMIAGKGFKSENPASQVNIAKLELDSILGSTALDLKLQGGVYWEVIYSMDHTRIVKVNHLPYENVRLAISDSEDEGNKYYKEDYSRTYGDRQILVQNDFVKDEKKIEIGFVPTIIVKPEAETDKYLPEIATNDGKTKSGDLRILQYKAKTCQSYLVRNGSFSLSPSGGAVKTKYPFMGHLDDPLTSTTDINFGMPRFIGLPPGTPVTNNNLFNAYWSKYLQEITDKDSKIVKGAFYLTPADMEKLSFRDLYFFDNNYFRLNKIEDYDPVNPSVNICEFLFLKSGVTFSATTGSVGAYFCLLFVIFHGFGVLG